MISVLDIVEDTTVDGPGFRTAVYAAGCPHRCPGCHNPQSWDIQQGTPMAVEEILEHILADEFANVTFSGGDPLFQPEGFLRLARLIKERSKKTIWCYTGYSFEAIMRHPVQRQLLNYIDVLVDGRFDQTQHRQGLVFRGSNNQRLLDVNASLKSNSAVPFNYNPYL